MYIVGFNGPPRSGKDTLAGMVREHMIQQGLAEEKIREESLSLPLRQIAFAMVGWIYVEGVTDPRDYDLFKDRFFPAYGKTGRELMIDVSERFMKLVYATEVFPMQMLTRNESFGGVLLVRDTGFQLELAPLIRAVGTRNVYVVRVQREFTTFEGDSREWVNHPDSGCSMTIHNDGTLAELRIEAGRVYGRLVNQMGWVL